MKKLKLLSIFGMLLSVLLTGCQSEEYSAANADSPVISDNNGGESAVSNDDQPEQSTDADSSVISDNNEEESAVSNDDQTEPSTGFQKYDEQISKYADRLPLEYEAGIPDKKTYGVVTDLDRIIISHMEYYNTTERKTDIYTDENGERHILCDYLMFEDAEIVFEDGTPASESDLTSGTPVLVESDYILESYPAQMHCTKIVILK